MTSRKFREGLNLSAVGFMLLLLSGAWLILPSVTLAQKSTAAINGTVTDPSGAVIPQATVRLRNVLTGVERSTVTNETGSYVFVDVLPGRYTLKVTKEGFSTATQPEFEMYVNQTATFDMALSVGASATEVTVQATSASIQASTAELGTVITTRSVQDLPLNGRNFTQLLQLTPGVSPYNVGQSQWGGGGGFAGRAIGTFTFPSVHGQRNRSNLFWTDGLNNTGSFIDNYNVEPLLDSIQEFKVQSHNDLAEFGQAMGGLINVVTKPGTNEYHGTVYEFLRNEKFDARNFFAAKRNPLRQNQFGATTGGPITIPGLYNGKNKTFFFAGYEGYRDSRFAQSLSLVPTPTELGGDLSGINRQIFNPFSTGPDPLNPGQFIRDPFMCDASGDPLTPSSTGTQPPGTPCNKIPSSMLNASSLLYAKSIFPAPVNTGVSGTNAINDARAITNQDTYSLRLDEQLRAKDSLFGRFSTFNQVDSSPGSLAGINSKVFLHGYNIAAHETHTFGPTAVLDVHFGRNWGQDNTLIAFDSAPANLPEQLISLGFSRNFIGNFRAGQGPFPPLLQMDGYGGPGGGNNVQNTRISDIWEFGGDFTKVRGRHTLKFGANFASNNSNSPIFGIQEAFRAPATADPKSPGTTGSALASFLLGLPDSGGKRNVLESMHGGWVDGFYVQDQWKATDKLTVNIGFRYDVTLWPIYGDFKNEEIFVGDLNLNDGTFVLAAVPPPCSPTRGEPCIPGGTLPEHVVVTPFKNHAIYHNNYDNWQGRLGFAYRLYPKTVVRASYGRFYDNWNSVVQLAQNYEGQWPRVGQLLGNNFNNNLINARIEDPFSLGSSGVVIPAPSPFLNPGFVQWYMDPLVQMPYSDNWNLGVEHQLTADTVLELNYVGSHSSRLNLGGVKNTSVTPGPAATAASRRPFPYSPTSFYDQSIGRASYHSFQFKLDKKASKGLSYLVSYTWSKSLDISCSGNFGSEGCELQNYYDLKAEKAVSGFDATHLFVASGVYQLPFGTGKRYSSGSRVVNQVIGNWQMNGILSFTSGRPYSVGIGNDINNTGNFSCCDYFTIRANPVPGVSPTPSGRDPSNWLNRAAFSIPPFGTFGLTSRNAFRSDRFKSLDFSIFRRFPITESMGVEFRAEAFNFTNTPVFERPVRDLNDPNFGKIFSTAKAEREIQFALKLIF